MTGINIDFDFDFDNALSVCPQLPKDDDWNATCRYIQHAGKCVSGHNISKHLGTTLKECKELCDDAGDACKGVEHYTDLGATATAYNPGDCTLSSSASTANCDAADYNMEFYEKAVGAAATPLTCSANDDCDIIAQDAQTGSTKTACLSNCVDALTAEQDATKQYRCSDPDADRRILKPKMVYAPESFTTIDWVNPQHLGDNPHYRGQCDHGPEGSEAYTGCAVAFKAGAADGELACASSCQESEAYLNNQRAEDARLYDNLTHEFIGYTHGAKVPHTYRTWAGKCVKGNNIAVESNKTFDQCKELCDNYGSGCVGVEYYRDLGHKYTRKTNKCVKGNNIAVESNKTFDECKSLCDNYGPGCKGIEYYTNFGQK